MCEKFDYIDSIVLINSLAGGTGSGLGSYVNIILKDYLPTINLLNASIFPHNAGEVVVNSYNTLFSLSESYKVSDMMSVINNQEIFDICREIYKDKKIGFENLNHIISKHLISALIPVH
jgi:tubulin delta